MPFFYLHFFESTIYLYMTAHEIIEQLAKEKFIEDVVAKYKTEYREDLCQLLYVYLLEMDEDKIIGLYERGELKYYVTRAIYYQIAAPRSYHAMQNKRPCGLIGEVSSINDNRNPFDIEDEQEDRQQMINEFIDSLPEMERDCIKVIGVRKRDRKKYINEFCDKYELKRSDYKRLVPELKFKLMRQFKNLYKKGTNYKRDKRIAQFNNNGKLIKIYPDLQTAAEDVGVKPESIMRVCRGDRKYCCNFRWKYMDEEGYDDNE